MAARSNPFIDSNEIDDPEVVKEFLDKVDSWLKENPHIKICTDAAFLLPFLRVAKYDIEKAKTRIGLFYSLPAKVPAIFSNWDPHLPEIQQLLNIGAVIPLTGVDKLGRSLIVFRVGRIPWREFNVASIFKLIYMVHYTWTEDMDTISRVGEVAINDLEGFSFSHLFNMDLALLKEGLTSMQKCAPVKVKAIHCLNMNFLYKSVFKIVTPFLQRKLQRRVHYHSNLLKLREFIPEESLPSDYGGCRQSLNELARIWNKRVTHNREALLSLKEFESIDDN